MTTDPKTRHQVNVWTPRTGVTTSTTEAASRAVGDRTRRQGDNTMTLPTIADRYAGAQPILFLDIDHTITHTNGGPIDRDALALVETCVRQADARIVLCSDRVRDVDACLASLHDAGLTRGWLVGHCASSPGELGLGVALDMPSLLGASSKVMRIVEWLELAHMRGCAPPSWCVVDDAQTLGRHWMTAPAHVKPSGPVITRLDMSRAWSLLLRKMPHDVRRACQAAAKEPT